MLVVGDYSVRISIDEMALGLVLARGCKVEEASGELLEKIEDAVNEARNKGDVASETGPVRDLLRFGKYKPTGRGKPASEYLLRSANNGSFPQINNLVDALNLVSLRYLIPISLIDVGRAESHTYEARRGREGESYVFNSAGQSIDLRDLLVIASLPDERPLANPVKDSMLAKLTPDSTDVLAVLYGPIARADALARATTALNDLFVQHSKANEVLCASRP